MLPLMVFALVFGVAVSRTAPRDRAAERLDAVSRAGVRCLHDHRPLRDAARAVRGDSPIIFNHGVHLRHRGVLDPVVLCRHRRCRPSCCTSSASTRAAPPLRGAVRRSHFFRQCRDVSSLCVLDRFVQHATLPLSLETAETKLQIPPDIARFVLTVGATANQNGTALSEGITVLLRAGLRRLELAMGQQVRVHADVDPRGDRHRWCPGRIAAYGNDRRAVGRYSRRGMGLILGVDRFLDMCRTTRSTSAATW